MTEDQEWGPWIDHDGMGCPDSVRGRVIEVEVMRFDQIVTGQIILVTSIIADSPLWQDKYFGHPLRTQSGRRGIAGKVIRYRIRKDRSVELMKAKAAALDKVSPKALNDA